MLQSIRDWLSKSPNQQSVIQRLSKESVRNHRNLRVEGEGGAPASQGSYAEQEAHQLQHTVMGYIPGAGLFSGNAKAVEGGSPGPSRPGGYLQAGGQQHGSSPGPPGYPGGPMGGGGHQHGGDRHGSTSTYTPPTAAPSHTTTFPLSGGGPSPLPAPHSGSAHHHQHHQHQHHTGPHTQHGGYTAPFPSGNSFPDPGRGGDGFPYPGSGTTSFPGGDGVSYPDTSFPGASPFPGASSFPDGGYEAPTGPPVHHGGYIPPAGPPPHGDGGYHAHPGGYQAPFGPHPGFPDSGGYGGVTGLEFPDPSARPGYNSERPDGYNPSYQGGGW